MKRLLFLLSILLFPLTVFASPFLVSDPYSLSEIQPDYFMIVIDGNQVNSPAVVNPDGTKQLKYDVGYVSSGAHSLTVKACKSEGAWGEICSDSVPFDFSKPTPAAPPSGLKLIK